MERKKLKIMIVEDETIVALDLKKMLQNCGYDICSVVNNGIDAIRRAAIQKPNLILMDILISGNLNGIETAKKIRSNFSIPVIFLTALSDDETFLDAQDVSKFGYIIKPFHENELKNVIKNSLAGSKEELKIVD